MRCLIITLYYNERINIIQTNYICYITKKKDLSSYFELLIVLSRTLSGKIIEITIIAL